MKKVIAVSLVSVAALVGVWHFAGKTESNDASVPGTAEVASKKAVDAAKRPSNAMVVDEGVVADLSSENYAKDFEQLLAKAKGNAPTAYAFAVQLSECQQLNRRLDATQDLEALNNVVKGSATDAVESIAARCEGLSREQISEYVALLDFAAQSGVVEAQLGYSTLAAGALDLQGAITDPEAFADYKKKSVNYLNQALSTGNSEALVQLGMAYQDGILEKKSPETAYAYFYAYSLAKPNSRMSDLLANLARDLTADQVDRATQYGASIFSNCCR